MIRHLVLFKLNPGVGRDDPRVVEGAAMFAALKGTVPELLSWECGWNISPREIAYDYAINSSVAGPAELTRYSEHPDHRAAVKRWQEFATWVVADLDL